MPFSSYTKGPFIYRRTYMPTQTAGVNFTTAPPSIENLDGSITLNSITETPFFRYNGLNANDTTWPHWTYGEIVDYQSGVAPSFNQGSPLLGTMDDSVKFNGGAYYKADNNTYADITTEDLVFEAIYRNDVSAYSRSICGKRATTTGNGWKMWVNGGRFSLTLDTGSSETAQSTILTDNVYHHVLICIDRDEASGTRGYHIYVNGQYDTGYRFLLTTGSATIAAPFELGACETGINGFDSHLAYVAGWKHANWMPGGAPNEPLWAAFAAERFARLISTNLTLGAGTTTPTTATRASLGTLEKYETDRIKIYPVGPHWMRGVHKKDASTADIKGLLIEGAHTNKLPYSEAFDSAFVTKTACSILADRVNSPYHGFVNHIVDADMEAVGVADWSVVTSATLSKAGSPFEGTQCLRVTYGADATDYAYQNIFSKGLDFTVTGYARSDGTSTPRVGHNGATLWTGTTSTSWQPFSVTYTNTATNIQLRFGASGMGGGNYVEFDAVTATTIPCGHSIVSTAADTLHSISYTYSATASDAIFSCYAKKCAKDWLYLAVNEPNSWGYFDLNTGSIGTLGANVDDSNMYDVGNGWWRVWIKFAISTASRTCTLAPAHADTDNDYAGDGINTDIYVFGWQMQEGDDAIVAYIPTASSSVSTAADLLKYKGDDGNLGAVERLGTFTATVLAADAVTYTVDKYVFALSDGGAATDIITGALNTSANLEAVTADSVGNPGYSEAIFSINEPWKHNVKVTWATDSVVATTDSTSGTEDIDCLPPDAIDEITIGADEAGANQFDGIISNIAFYNEII